MENKLIHLAICAKKGDIEAFSTLITSLEQDLYRIASIKLKLAEDIDDAIGATIEQALKNITKLRRPEYVKTWIIRILINNCNAIYKKSKLRLEFYENIYSCAKNVNDEIDSKLDFYILIKDLNEKEQLTITLYYSEDLTAKEISRILKEPESTVRNRLARAVEKLKKYLGGSNYEQQ